MKFRYRGARWSSDPRVSRIRRRARCVLDPGWTNFASRVDYATYDVTDQVENGANCIGVTLGNGWYNPLPLRLFGSFNLRDHLPIGRPRFLAQLNVEFEDGSTQSIDSNLSWKVGDGAIRFDNVYLGEVVDARKERLGWSNAGFADAHWGSPAIATELVGALQAQPQPPIRITERIVPIHRSEPKPGVFIYDFGQEFAGWASIQLNAPTGAKMVLRYGELLKPDGTLNIMTSVAGQIKGSRKNEAGVEESVGGPGAPPIAWQSDTFIAKGGGKETYTPRFTFHGFRYLEVTGLPEPPALTDVTGLRLNSDVKDAGSFSCSNDRFNQIQQMVRRTFLANIFSVQSDCPHRERLGYGGDMVGTTEAFMLNFDMAAFYAKTVRDFADAKRPDGMLTDTAPFIGIQYCGVGWAMAHPLLTSQLNRYYGDYRLVETQYETAKEWLLLVSKQYEDGIVTDGLSDHESLEPNPSPEMVTPLYYQSALLLRGMAQGLDRKSDVEQFQALADKIKLAYQKSFVSRSGKVGPGTQGSQSFALYSDLLSPEDRGKALDFLLDKIRVDGKGHLSTGLMGTKFMLDTLSREGYAEDAYRIVDQPDFPGWQWMLTNGATTLWEHWAKEESVYSHCHPMFGSVSQWFINWLGGIQPAPGSFGFDQIVIRPQFVKELTWVKSSHTGMYGEIVSNWRREADKLVLDIDVPVGSTALVYLPAARQEQIQESLRPVQRDHNITFVRSEQSYQVLKVSSGHYEFSVLPH